MRFTGQAAVVALLLNVNAAPVTDDYLESLATDIPPYTPLSPFVVGDGGKKVQREDLWKTRTWLPFPFPGATPSVNCTPTTNNEIRLRHDLAKPKLKVASYCGSCTELEGSMVSMDIWSHAYVIGPDGTSCRWEHPAGGKNICQQMALRGSAWACPLTPWPPFDIHHLS